MFYGIKKSIITSNINKRRAAGYGLEASELYTLPKDAGADINNSYFFAAHTMAGESMYIRLGLRGDGSHEVWFAWRMGDRFVECERELYAPGETCPLCVECTSVGRLWHIAFNGTMRDVAAQDRKTYRAMFEGDFTATTEVFDFFYDNDPSTTAAAIASEKWNKQLFSEIEKNNQRHYEQGGRLTGTLRLGSELLPIDLGAARDHSFGRRNWSYMDLHFWIMAVDGDGNILNISRVSYPAVKGIWTGYTTMFGGLSRMTEIKCETKMSQAGFADGRVHLDVTLDSGKKIAIDTLRETEAIYHFDNGSYYFSEGIGSFVIDGKPARGTIEFSYNGDKSRWEGR